MPLDAVLDEALCPLCGNSNQCAMEVEKTTGIAQPPCWCASLTIGEDLLAAIPEDSRGLACICSACAHRNQTSQPT
jgi:Cysteine-rich CWC